MRAAWQGLPTSSAAAAFWCSVLATFWRAGAQMPSALRSPVRPYANAVPGDLSLCLPKRQLDNILETLAALDKIARAQ